MKKFTVLKSLIIILTILISFVMVSIEASALSLNTFDRGWYSSDGVHFPANNNYAAGFAVGSIFHNFFVFDLSGVTDTVCSADLFLFNPFGYSSPDPNETYELFDVSTDIPTLITGGMGLTGIFDDLGSGVSFGSTMVSLADNGHFVSITLNASGIEAVNEAAGGSFAIGGAVTTLAQADDDEVVFGGTDTPDPADGNTYLELGFEGCDGGACEEAQMAVQSEVGNEDSNYKNHGKYVRAAAHEANQFDITEECHDCIVDQFARRIPIEEQEVCTDTAAPTGCCLLQSVSCEEQVTEQDCPSDHVWIENGVCDGGGCVCDPGLTECAGTCVDLDNDNSNCGACGNACGLNQHCDGGGCVCDPGLTECAGTCVDRQSDPQNCGTCGNACGIDQECVGGVCECIPKEEICDSIDNDCDGQVDESVPDGGQCGTNLGECEFGVLQCVGGSFVCVGGVEPTAEICDGLDNDCDGIVDEGCALDGDGFPAPVDCDDSNPSINPAAGENCVDGIDNDCNRLIDSADPLC